jgi:hypothetical protein
MKESYKSDKSGLFSTFLTPICSEWRCSLAGGGRGMHNRVHEREQNEKTSEQNKQKSVIIVNANNKNHNKREKKQRFGWPSVRMTQ